MGIGGGGLIVFATWSKAWVYGYSLFGTVGSNPAGSTNCLSVVSVVCCQVDVSASDRLLVRRSATERGVQEHDRGTL